MTFPGADPVSNSCATDHHERGLAVLAGGTRCQDACHTLRTGGLAAAVAIERRTCPCCHLGREEKLDWQYGFTVDDVPCSHGAFGSKGRAAMFVQVPDVGAVPVTLGEFGVRTELLFVPAVKDDFEAICAVFDSCDEWLANGLLAEGHKWVLEGLNFRFDAQFRTDLADVRSKGRFDEFLEANSYQIDAVMNMDI